MAYHFDNAPRETRDLLARIVESQQRILGDNLIGVYLHGSLAMGCWSTECSDIDFIVVVKRALKISAKKAIIRDLLNISNDAPPKGLEMSVVLELHVSDFIYPTPFELHFSNEHQQRYIDDPDYICGNDIDRDLAAHFTVIKNYGVCLWGRAIDETFGEVPEADYIDSLMYDLEDIDSLILRDPVYGVLNLCRVLCYLREKRIVSKAEGGKWACRNVRQEFVSLVERVTAIYTGEADAAELAEADLNQSCLRQFTRWMMGLIEKHFESR